jgi:hypothetical protein
MPIEIEITWRIKNYGQEKSQMEIAYQKRDNLMPSVKEMISKSRNILKGVHLKDLKALHNYGFSVDDTPRKKKTN